jgi:hypothetical protein
MAVATSTLIIGAIVAAGAGYSAYSQNAAGKAQQTLSNYNASITEQAGEYNAQAIEQSAAYNASLARLEARTTAIEGMAQAGIIRSQGRRLQGTQRARMGSSGVVVGTGSPLAVEVAQAGFVEMRALEAQRQAGNKSNMIANSVDVELAKAKLAAGSERWSAASQAALDRMGGNAARSAGRMNATATILQGAGKVAGGYYGMS